MRMYRTKERTSQISRSLYIVLLTALVVTECDNYTRIVVAL